MQLEPVHQSDFVKQFSVRTLIRRGVLLRIATVLTRGGFEIVRFHCESDANLKTQVLSFEVEGQGGNFNLTLKRVLHLFEVRSL